MEYSNFNIGEVEFVKRQQVYNDDGNWDVQ